MAEIAARIVEADYGEGLGGAVGEYEAVVGA
jgi:hypothetical protein